MTPPPADSGAARSAGLLRSTWLRVGVGLIALVVVVTAAYGGWYLFLRPAGPAPVNLAALPAASAGPTQAAAPVTSAPASSAPASPAVPSTSAGAPGTLDGTWKVNTAIGSGGTGSFVGYRVQEQLAGIGANTAVGRTSHVTGSFTMQGTTISAATITADLTTLQSDSSSRDRQLVNRGLETATDPTATFVLTKPIDLGRIPAAGQVVSVSATGQLTLHGQTRTVQVALQARLSAGVVAIAGSLPITFSDYAITPPTSFFALSVADHGTMELQLMFTHV